MTGRNTGTAGNLSAAAEKPRRIVVMGVSGCGKTTIGDLVARALGVPFLDGDSLHPVENVAKMAAGTPLTDDDRWPWLAEIGRRFAASDLRLGDRVQRPQPRLPRHHPLR